LRDSSAAYLSEIIIETLLEANEEIPENFLTKLLRGEKVKESAALFKHFGACRKFSMAEIKGVIADQISKGKILRSIGKRNYLSLPKADKDKSEKVSDIRKSSQDTKNYDDELYLFNQLREARKKAANRFMQSGYLICPDHVLREVARMRPMNKAALLGISGFNSRMFNKLGIDFLEIIKAYKPDKLLKKETKEKRALPQNIVETKKLIQKKYTLKEIAETRKLSEAVISMQVETIVEFEPHIDISSLIKKETLQTILEETEKGFENLKELKERLPSRINYPEIRIAVAKYRATSHLPSLNPQRRQ
jgi:ATP-dependent DNA helicase RecQ